MEKGTIKEPVVFLEHLVYDIDETSTPLTPNTSNLLEGLHVSVVPC